jgi:hypothetical protein
MWIIRVLPTPSVTLQRQRGHAERVVTPILEKGVGLVQKEYSLLSWGLTPFPSTQFLCFVMNVTKIISTARCRPQALRPAGE